MKFCFYLILLFFLSFTGLSFPEEYSIDSQGTEPVFLIKKIEAIETIVPDGLFREPSDLEGRTAVSEIVSPEDVDEMVEFQSQEIKEDSLILYRNEKIDRYIKFYLGNYRKNFIKGLIRGKKYFPIFRKMFRQKNLPEELIYLSVIESNIDPGAVSHAKAAGIWQFMKHTGESYGLQTGWWKDERRDVFKSTQAAAKLLKDLHEKYGSWELALAAYNAGIGRVNRAIARNRRQYKPTDYDSLRLPKETENYVPQFFAVANIIKNYKQYGLVSSLFTDEPYPEFKTIQVPQGVSFAQISRKLGIPLRKINLLNSQYVRKYTSLDHSQNLIRVPKKYRVSQAALAAIKKDLHGRSLVHKVENGESLWTISRRYSVSVLSIKSFNPKLYRNRYIRSGMKLIIPQRNPVSSSQVTQGKGSSSTDRLYHLVRAGDSLIKIAKRYKVDLEHIVRSNASVSHRNDIIRVGMKLAIPTAE